MTDIRIALSFAGGVYVDSRSDRMNRVEAMLVESLSKLSKQTGSGFENRLEPRGRPG